MRRHDSRLVDACAETLRQRVRRSLERAEARAQVLRDRSRDAAAQIARRHGATRVWLFGSLAWGDVHEETDVDLLVEGVPHDLWSAATKTAEDTLEAPVDLVRADEASAELMDRVLKEGVLLHDAR